jgi:hypothetical protein
VETGVIESPSTLESEKKGKRRGVGCGEEKGKVTRRDANININRSRKLYIHGSKIKIEAEGREKARY